MKIREKAIFFEVIKLCYRFFKDFTNHRKKTDRTVLLQNRPLSNIVKYKDQR